MAKHIYVNQSLAERNVPVSFINKLYNMCLRKNNMIDSYDNTSNMIGMIMTGYTFQEYIDVIRQQFPQLDITAAGLYIYFEDPHVLQKLIDAGYGDEYDNVTTANAKTITFGNLFKNDTEIISFNTFNMFTKQQSTACSFEGCTNLLSINLSNLSGNPTNAMFMNCTNLTSIDDLGSITQISTSMFEGCTSLEHISIPSTVNKITTRAFYRCTSLHLTLEDLYNVSAIGGNRDYGPFNYRNSTPSVLFDEETLYLPNLTSCTECAFNMQRFKYIDLPNVSYIGGVGTFAYNTVLTEVRSIGDSLTVIMGDGIANNGNIFNASWRVGMFHNCTNLEKVTLPSGLTMISQNMFINCTKLHTLNLEEIENNIIYVQNDAFDGCNALPRTFNFPNCVFFGIMNNLTRQQSIYIPKITITHNPTNIQNANNFNTSQFSYRGNGCIFNTLYFRDIEEFGCGTFAYVTVTSLIINNTIPPRLSTISSTISNTWASRELYSQHVFAKCNFTNIYVPDSAVNIYKTHELYTEYADSIKPLSECPRITREQSNDGIPGVIEAYL